jgi:putative FmdB family regulatory protein
MPIYEYQCKKCGRVFEYMQKISDEPLKTCPADICEHGEEGRGEVERLISKNVGLVFNGSGFYLTDYARKKKSNGTSAPAAETKSAESKPTNGTSEKTAKA